MRTVTFSNDKVAKAVNDGFIATWVNRNPRFHNCELGTEQGIVVNSYEIFATRNFCTFFATPDQETLHYMSGYYNPEFFLNELDFAKELAKASTGPEESFDPAKRSTFLKLHQQRETYYKDRRSALVKNNKLDAAVSGSGARRTNLLDGLDHLQEVHHWFRNTFRTQKLSLVQDLFKTHMAKNSFTEE